MTERHEHNSVPITGLLLLLSLSLAGCATYSPDPLPVHAYLLPTAPMPDALLDMDRVATVAVLNNPDLKTTRAKAQVSAAQAFAAGLLPNPQINATLDRPTASDTGLVNGYGLGITLDVQSLLTRPATAAAANAAREQARLELLWQEWQTVAEARGLYVRNVTEASRRELLAAAEKTYALQAVRSGRALQTADITLDQAGGDLAVLSDVRSRRGVAERSAMQADQALHALLGIAPGVALSLQALQAPELMDRTALDHAISDLTGVRPDLRALQAGYRSQELLLRKAVISQFPNIAVGFGKARDTSDVHTTNFGVTLSLPIFNRGQGDIAIARATRAQMRAEYQARLDQATGDSSRLWAELQQLRAQIADAESRMPQLQATVERAAKAYEVRDMTVTAYLTMLNSLLNSQSELLDLRASLWTDAIALSAVLGTQVQPATTP